MTNENIELFRRIVNYQAVSLCHIGIAVRLVRHRAAMGNIYYPLLSTLLQAGNRFKEQFILSSGIKIKP